MNLQKAEIKMLISQEFGSKFEDKEELALAEVHRFEGAIGGLRQSLENMESVKARYHQERDEEKISVETLESVIRAIDLCRGTVSALIDVAQAQKLMKQGEWTAYRDSKSSMKESFDLEKTKLENALKAIETGELPSTVRPINTAVADLDARRAEARKKKSKKIKSKAPVKKD